MEENESDRPPSGSALRIALVVLAIALAAAVSYIVNERNEIDRLTAGAAAPTTAAAAARPPENRAAILTAAQQQVMVDTLKRETGADRKVWFHVQRNNPETAAVLAALQRVFEQAGWTTEAIQGAYPLKSGLFLLAGDEQPPAYVDTVDSAFRAAGIDVQYLTGYRAFFTDRKQQNPNWVGPELAPDQTFVLVIGAQPTPRAGM